MLRFCAKPLSTFLHGQCCDLGSPPRAHMLRTVCQSAILGMGRITRKWESGEQLWFPGWGALDLWFPGCHVVSRPPVVMHPEATGPKQRDSLVMGRNWAWRMFAASVLTCGALFWWWGLRRVKVASAQEIMPQPQLPGWFLHLSLQNVTVSRLSLQYPQVNFCALRKMMGNDLFLLALRWFWWFLDNHFFFFFKFRNVLLKCSRLKGKTTDITSTRINI